MITSNEKSIDVATKGYRTMNRISVVPDAPGYSARVTLMGFFLTGRGATERIALWDLRNKLDDHFRIVQEIKDEIAQKSSAL